MFMKEVKVSNGKVEYLTNERTRLLKIKYVYTYTYR